MYGDYQIKEFEETVVEIKRISKKTKGGNTIRFSALVVVGDKKGKVGIGLSKAPDVSNAIRKALEKAKRRMVKVSIRGTTIPYSINEKYSAARVLLKPAPPGSGIIAGGPMRAVFEVLGVTNVLAKCLGSTNPYNIVRATLNGLQAMNTPSEIAAKRGKSVEEITG